MKIKTNRFAQAVVALLILAIAFPNVAEAALRGRLVGPNDLAVPGVRVESLTPQGETQSTAITDEQGRFLLSGDGGTSRLRVWMNDAAPETIELSGQEVDSEVVIETSYELPVVSERLTVSGRMDDVSIGRILGEASLAGPRQDNKLIEGLDAGISTGQHEGGGKSAEVRRYGYNSDHGGVGGGLRVVIDGVQQNQSTQGHGQGYLGSLKSLSPELINGVRVLDGPFSVEHGDFSGLGVISIQLKEQLDEMLTVSLTGGQHGLGRAFVGYSPRFSHARAFLAYEGSRAEGPFVNPLILRRDTLSGNFTRLLGAGRTWEARFNVARNDFNSPGQIPLDEVEAGRLDRFASLDPFGGGRVRSGTVSLYFRDESPRGDQLTLDGFITRSLFDLYSNFTFFLENEHTGDGIQQHDSRLQQGINLQYARPGRWLGRDALLVIGGNFQAGQINVGLSPQLKRVSRGITTRAFAHIVNAAGYVQHSMDFWNGLGLVESGLRLDVFRFGVENVLNRAESGTEIASLLQPKLSLTLRPFTQSTSFHVRYGRGFASQDARGVVANPNAPKLSTTDFYQAGAQHRLGSIELESNLFLIDRSSEQVYIPDDGSIEFRGPSRAYGFDVRASLVLARRATLSGNLTRVSNAFYKHDSSEGIRSYVSGAPHTVAGASLTLVPWRGYRGTLRFRHISGYRLDELDPGIRAAGHSVLDLTLSRALGSSAELSIGIDNLANRRYYETQNYFESRLSPDAPSTARIHGTSGSPFTLAASVTFYIGRN